MLCILFFGLYLCPVSSWAQTAGAKASQWQQSFDAVKAKAQALSQKNAMLMQEYDGLIKQDKDLQGQIQEWQVKNQEIKNFLSTRNGRTDQQIQIDELNGQINEKKQDIALQQKAIAKLQKRLQTVMQVVHLKRLKLSDLELIKKRELLESKKANQSSATADPEGLEQELAQVKQRWQQEKDREAGLQKQLQELKDRKNSPQDSDVDEQTIKALELRVQDLSLQKEGLQNRKNVDNNTVNDGQVKLLVAKKKELEDKIKLYESQLNLLKNSASMGLDASSQRKQTMQQMIALDTKNAKLRKKIADVRQDIILLKDQINRLERKVNYTRDTDFKRK